MILFNRNIGWLVVVWLFVSSCTTVKPILMDIPEEDTQSIFYFREGLSPGDGAGFASRTIGDAQSLSLSSASDKGLTLASSSLSHIEPSISADGMYIAANTSDRLPPNDDIHSQQSFGIYSLKEMRYVRSAQTRIPCLAMQGESYSVPWSLLGHSFFTVHSDTIKKNTPDGKQHVLTYIENLKYFSVSPSERWLLFAQENRAGLLDMDTRTVIRVKEFESILGIDVSHCIRSAAWSFDERSVAYTLGQRLVVLDIEGNQNITVKAEGDVFDVEWISNNDFVFVVGYEPARLAVLKDEPYFTIYSYSLPDRKEQLLHHRRNHEPVSVKPRRSPSGKLLLFSEKEFDGDYSIMMMALDGSGMTKLCKGYSPVWGR